MKTSFLIILFALSVNFLSGQTALPQSYNFDGLTERDSWKQYKIGQSTGPYEWEFEKPQNGDSFALVHYYPVGGTQVSEDWMVSELLDFSKGAVIDSLQHLMKGFGSPQPDDTVALYLIEGNRDPRLASSKTIVYDFLRTNFRNDNVWYTENKLAIDSSVQSGYLAFRYKTIVNWLDIKIDNIHISPTQQDTTGNEPSSVNQSSALKISFYPNPARSRVFVEFNSSTLAQIKVFDMIGNQVLNETLSNTESFSIESLNAGNYLLHISVGQELKKEKLIVY